MMIQPTYIDHKDGIKDTCSWILERAQTLDGACQKESSSPCFL